MSEHNQSVHDQSPTESYWRLRSGVVLIVFLAIAGLLLAYEHRVHVLTGNGILIVLLGFCVGMHLFMHGGHGGHRHDGSSDDGEP